MDDQCCINGFALIPRGMLAIAPPLVAQLSVRINHLSACRSPCAKKRLAVPFRAADLPSERSEFSQPDVALLYTHIAYYGDGLSRTEFKEAVLMLLGRGPIEQAFHYNRWLAQGRACGTARAGKALQLPTESMWSASVLPKQMCCWQ